jgi:hypothetical protein
LYVTLSVAKTDSVANSSSDETVTDGFTDPGPKKASIKGSVTVAVSETVADPVTGTMPNGDLASVAPRSIPEN